MLKLKVKPTANLGVQEIHCYNVYISPDLNYISGRTSCYNGILNGEPIRIVNNKNKFVSICKAKAENVKVQGKVKLDIELPIHEIEKKLVIGYNLEDCKKKYVEYKGAISYEYNGNYLVEGSIYSVESDADTSITISTFSYIEDGFVKIGDKEYIADFREGGKPNIMETKYATPLTENARIGKNIIYKGVSEYSPTEWKRETKFELYKEGDYDLEVDDVLYGGYDHYIIYHDEYYYLKKLYDENGEYVGYGVEIDGVKYTNLSRQIYDGDGILPYDNLAQLQGSILMLSDNEDDYYIVQDTLISPKNNGNFLFIATNSQRLDIKTGDTIIAKSNGPVSTKLNVLPDDEEDESENKSEYVIYLGVRYDVIHGIYKSINVSDSYHRLITEAGDGYDAYAYFGSDKVYYKIEGNKAIPTNKIYYKVEGDTNIKYGLLPEGYDIETNDGVIIGDEIYMVHRESYDNDDDDNIIIYSYIEISEDVTYNLTITDKSGSNLYICYPEVSNESLPSDYDIATTRRFICDTLVRSKDNFTFYIRNDVLGEKPIYPDTYLYDAVIATKPFYAPEKINLSFFKVNTYANFKLPIVNTLSNDLLKSNQESARDRINKIVDMEKDVYYPVWVNGSDYNPINCVRFNMHFRTRQLDTWKVIEDYVEDENENKMTNWFITDYEFYKKALENSTIRGSKSFQNASDVIGFLGFTESEARNRAKKIGKSFLRLSFFSTNDPQTQVLLGTSTIFIDDALLCKKCVSLQTSSEVGEFLDTRLYQSVGEEGIDLCKTTYIKEFSEFYNDGWSYNFENDSYLRLSSRIEVYDKHATIGSSEGFYFYMFKEFANNMRPLRIYLKIDFNHAGFGKTIPFIIPRKNIEDGVGKPLYVHVKSDLEELKKGFKLKDIYKQLYIPIDVIFDDKTNKYVYYLPEQLRENFELGVDDDIMEFNLFEVKFKDESVVENESN